ncbi:NAD-dependent epimerase/dehydratase family protein [Chloroflexota bacterium]
MDIKGKRILVTGDNGFVGRHLVERLKQKGAEVIILKDIDGYRIDVRDWQKIKNLAIVDIIYHLAGITHTPFSLVNPREIYEVNVLGTINMLELSRLHNVEKLIFASSYVYGHPQYLPIDEKHPIEPTSPYARSKVLAEQLCYSYSKDFGVKYIILRCFNIYGEGQNEDFLIPLIVKQLRIGKIELEDPEPKRDFVYISDVINAYIESGSFDGDSETFNIGYGKSYSVKGIVDKVIQLRGRYIEVNYRNNRRKNEIMNTVADISKAKDKLNWKPMVSIEEGLNKMIEATREV